MVQKMNLSPPRYRLFQRQSLQDRLRYICPEVGGPQEREGLLINKGIDGLYFEAQEYLKPRSRLYLMLRDPYLRDQANKSEAQKLYLATVRWCRELQSPLQWQFGVGAKFLSRECEWCGEIFPYEQMHYTESKSILCDNCLRDLEALQVGRLKLSLTNHLLGNVL